MNPEDSASLIHSQNFFAVNFVPQYSKFSAGDGNTTLHPMSLLSAQEDAIGYGRRGTAAEREALWNSTFSARDEKLTTRTNLNPRMWGSVVWATLHAIAEGLSERPSAAERRAFEDFVRALTHLLPCESCRHDLRLTLREIGPLDARTRDAACAYVVRLHNHVNARLKKPTWRVADARAAFAQMLRTATSSAAAPTPEACAASCALKMKRARSTGAVWVRKLAQARNAIVTSVAALVAISIAAYVTWCMQKFQLKSLLPSNSLRGVAKSRWGSLEAS